MTIKNANTWIPRKYVYLSMLLGIMGTACSSGGSDVNSASATENSLTGLTTSSVESSNTEESSNIVELASANPDSSGFGKVVTFDWNQAESDDQGYNIFYESENGLYQLAVQVSMSDLVDGSREVRFDLPSDASLPDGTACFTVSAWNSFGETAQSEVLCAEV